MKNMTIMKWERIPAGLCLIVNLCSQGRRYWGVCVGGGGGGRVTPTIIQKVGQNGK